MNISLLGCGRWGSFIGWYLDKIGHHVTIWGLSSAPQLIELKETRKNNMLTFRDSIEITDDLASAVNTPHHFHQCAGTSFFSSKYHII